MKGCPDCELEDAVTALLIGRGMGRRRAREIAKEILTLVGPRKDRDDY